MATVANHQATVYGYAPTIRGVALDPRLAEIVEALRDLIAERRTTQAEVERRARLPKRYLTRLFGGGVGFYVVHIFRILEAIDVEPQAFWLRLAGQSTTPEIERRLAALEAAQRAAKQ